MKNDIALLAVGAFALLGACSRTENGDVVVKRPSDVDVKTTQDTLHMPTVTTQDRHDQHAGRRHAEGHADRQQAGRRDQEDRSQGSGHQRSRNSVGNMASRHILR